jgi:hypothetical protein
MDRQGVNAAGKLTRKGLVDHAVPVDPALPTERFRHDMNSEMRLPARPMTGMALMPVRLVNHIEALRRERGGELFGDLVPDLHEIQLGGLCIPVNRCEAGRSPGKTICQDLKVSSTLSHNVRS